MFLGNGGFDPSDTRRDEERLVANNSYGSKRYKEPSSGLDGVRLRELDGETRSAVRAPRQLRGVLITDVTGRAAMEAGLQEGDVIVAVNQTRIEDINTLERALERNDADRLVLRLWNQGYYRYTVYRRER